MRRRSSPDTPPPGREQSTRSLKTQPHACAAPSWLALDILDYRKVIGPLNGPGTAGGDRGALIVAQLGHTYPGSIIGLYSHLPIQLSHYLGEHVDVPPGIAYSGGLPEASEYGEDEQGWARQNSDFFDKESGYGFLQLSEPQTIGVALADSPAGQLARTNEKRRGGADTGGDIESVWTKDDLITAATLYWVTNTGATSARYYKEALLNPWQRSHDRYPVVEAPTALSAFPSDVLLMPHNWSKEYYNLQQYRVHDK